MSLRTIPFRRAQSRRGIVATAAFTCILLPATGLAQGGRGGSDWSANGGDAQRSSWVRTDPKISAESMKAPGFQFMWKVKFRNDSGSLSAPVLQDRYIGYRGFRTYAFIGGSGDNVFTLDTDLGRIEWQKHFPLSAKAGSGVCPGGMRASVTRDLTAGFPGAGGGGRGRGAAAKSGVGAPGEGAVTLVDAAPQAARGPAPVASAAAPAAGPGRGRTPTFLRVVSSDGAFHNMYISNGEEPEPPIRFLPANANLNGLIVVDNVAYGVTAANCGGVPDGLWALDIATKTVTNWKGSIAGTYGPAFAADGTVYVATPDGEIVSFEPKSLNKKASYSAGQALVSSPVIFEYKRKTYIAASAKDGTVHVLDAASLAKSVTFASERATTLTVVQDLILATSSKGVTAWKMSDSNGIAFQQAWTSKEIASPTTPLAVNGVVFVAAAGNGSSHARLYALDAASGTEVWNSANTITSYIPANGGLAAGGSAVYLGTHDGTFWAFGFPIEH